MVENEITIRDSQQVETVDRRMDELLDDFIGSLKNASKKTKDTYRTNIKPYINWLKDNDRSGKTEEDVEAYREYLIPKYTAATVSSYIAVVRIFYKYLEAKRIMPNVATGIRGLHTEGHRKAPFTVDDIRKILETMPRKTISDVRNYAMINLLVRTGLRTVEVIRANKEDIVPVSRKGMDGTPVMIMTMKVQGKGHHAKDQTIVLTPAAYQPIVEYLELRGHVDPKDPLFVSHAHRNDGARLDARTIRSVGKDAMKNAKVINELNSHLYTCHSFRHTAIDLIVENEGIEAGQKMARHKSPETTMIYYHDQNRISENAPEFALDRLLDGQ